LRLIVFITAPNQSKANERPNKFIFNHKLINYIFLLF
jgi:hypothetical protein